MPILSAAMTAVSERPAASDGGEQAAKPVAPKQAAYYVSPVVDAVAVGGLSILVWFVLYLGFQMGWHDGLRSAGVISLGATMVWIINWPHFAATATRLYTSAENRRQFPVTTYVVPIILLAGAIIALQNPTSVAPWFVKIFLIWSPYHFSGQTIGVAMLYAGRHGFKVSPEMRRALNWFVYATYINLQAKTEQVGSLPSDFWGVREMPIIGIPQWVVPISFWAMVGLAIVLALTVVDASNKGNRNMPWIMAVPVLAQVVWFHMVTDVRSFAEFVPMFHSLQYLFLAWFIQMSEWDYQPEGEVDPAVSRAAQREAVRRLITRTAMWGAWIFVLGGILFRWGPRAVSSMSGLEYLLVVGVFTATVQIHHFFVDGVIWKLRNPRVRAALYTSIGQLVPSPSASDDPA